MAHPMAKATKEQVLEVLMTERKTLPAEHIALKLNTALRPVQDRLNALVTEGVIERKLVDATKDSTWRGKRKLRIAYYLPRVADGRRYLAGKWTPKQQRGEEAADEPVAIQEETPRTTVFTIPAPTSVEPVQAKALRKSDRAKISLAYHDITGGKQFKDAEKSLRETIYGAFLHTQDPEAAVRYALGL